MADSTLENLTDIAGAGGFTTGDLLYVFRSGAPDTNYKMDTDDLLTFINDNAGFAANGFKTIAVSGQSDVVADSSTDTLTLAAGTGMAITTNAGTDTVTHALSSNAQIKTITCVFDGGGSAITANTKAYVEVPFGMTITGWTLVGDQSGSIVIDVWTDTYAKFPPTVADTIAGTEKPTISSATKGQDISLSSWTTTVTAGDVLGFNVDSCTTITRATLVIRGTLSS